MPKRKRASLGVALIARDAEDTIGQCLDSFRRHVEQIVVGVDELSKDKTAAVAKRHGADLVVPVQVSDWHECPHHGRILAQDFAQARNQSFGYLDRSLDWWAWFDADDRLKEAERLPDLCDQLVQTNALGAWLAYEYGNVQGRPSTLFHRERILRASVGWKWRYRVHEVVEPTGKTDGMAWQIRGPDDVRPFHLDHPRSEPAAARNLRLLEIDLEELGDNDGRTLFYLGNQYHALQDNEAAAYWYERLLSIDTNPYQRWQGATYLSITYARMGAWEQAEAAAFRAISVMPMHPEPYYQLAAIARAQGNAERCLYWTKEARRDKQPPPFFVFKNPLDYDFNHRLVVSDALAMLGHVPEARQELEEAARVLPDKNVTDSIERYQKLENWGAVAQAFTTLAAPLNDEQRIALWEALDFPPDVRQFGRARDLVMPAYLRQRPNTQPRIVFWCGRSLEEWAPPVINTTGIGGSETAVVEIASRFARTGWRVDVYNGAGRYEGVYDGVGYWEPERWYPPESPEIWVSWRRPQDWNVAPLAHKRLLWCHDLNYGPQALEHFTGWDKVLGVSRWHADMLKGYYGVEADYVPNGVDPARFHPDSQRVGMQCVYTSSPDRGLDALLGLWPRIVEAEPGARLIVAYGFENVDRMIATGQRPQLAEWKDHMLGVIDRTPNVSYVGRLPQDRLAQLFSESYAWLYPTQFLEVSCITAMEALAGGAVPVTSSVGALAETVAGFGITIPGMPWSKAWGDFFVISTLALLTQPNLRMPLSLNGPKRASELTWDKAFERWQMIVDGILSDRTEPAIEREAALV